MPKLPNEDTQRWVRFWVRSVRSDSTVRKLKRADRCIFYEYIALARWQPSAPRLRGCLCDADGRPWTRNERAEAVGESYGVVKAAEEAMQEAGLITFHEGAAAHHSSKGRLRIVKYDHYQGGINGEETAFHSEGCDVDQPSILKADAFSSEGCNGDQPSILKADSSDETAFNSEGTQAERSTGASAEANESDEETAFNSEGKASIEVNDVNDVEERQETAHEALAKNGIGKKNHSLEERQDFWRQFQSLNVGGMPSTYRQIVEPQFERTPIDLAVDAAVVAVAKRQGSHFDWRDCAEHVVHLMQIKCAKRRERMEGQVPSADQDRRESAMLEWQAEIEREDAARRKLEEAAQEAAR